MATTLSRIPTTPATASYPTSVGKPRITQADRSARRKVMAAEIRAIAKPDRYGRLGQVAGKYGVDVSTVRTACREHGIKIPRPKSQQSNAPMPISAFAILREILLGKSNVEIADKFKLTRQRVHQIRANADKHGILKLFAKARAGQ